MWLPGPEDPLKKEVASHSSILACEILWTEEPGGWAAVLGRKEFDTSQELKKNSNIYPYRYTERQSERQRDRNRQRQTQTGL